MRALGIIAVTLGLGALMPFGNRRRIAARWCGFCYRALDIQLEINGEPLANGPAMLVGNHISYVDILLLGAAMDTPTFVAKSDVASWPLIGPLAGLAGVVFVRRDRPEEAKEQIKALSERLEKSERLVLFPEGTSSDGLDVLPFKSTLLGAVFGRDGGVPDTPVQSFTVDFRRRPDGTLHRPEERARFGWVGDATLLPHVWDMLSGPGAIATITFDTPIRADTFANRKRLSDALYDRIRNEVVGTGT